VNIQTFRAGDCSGGEIRAESSDRLDSEPFNEAVEKDFLDIPLFPAEVSPTSALDLFDTVASLATVSVVPKAVPDVIKYLSIDEIEPRDGDQVVLDQDFLNLCSSIQRRGILKPITVIVLPNNLFRIKFGNKRFHAAQYLGLPKLKARVTYQAEGIRAEVNELYELIEADVYQQKFSSLKRTELILKIMVLESNSSVAAIHAAINRESNVHRGTKLSTHDEQILEVLRGVLERVGIAVNTYRTEYLPLIDLSDDLRLALQNKIPKDLVLDLRKHDLHLREQILNAMYDLPEIPSVRVGKKMIRATLNLSEPESQFTQLAKRIDKHLTSLKGDYDHISEIDFAYHILELLVKSFESKMPFDWHRARTFSSDPDDV
jgi:ParB-like nuclease domain